MRRLSTYFTIVSSMLTPLWLGHAQFRATQVNTWSATADMAAPRAAVCSVRMADGRVLMAGGAGPSGALNSVELYGLGGAFTKAAPLLQARANSACVTLNDGRVLITGGSGRDRALRSAEVYDPAADAWSSAGNMSAARSGHTATITASGAVLLVGGEATGAVEAFLTDGTFVVAGKLSSPRNDYALAVLPNRKIMIAGGSSDATAIASVDIYNPDDNSVAPAANMRTPRRNFAAAVLFDGTVFLTGGYDQKGEPLAATEIYDPLKGISIAGPALRESRAGHRAYTLPDNGKVMIVGGTDGANPLATVEIYTPWTGRLQSTARMQTARTAMAGALMRRGAIVVAGGQDLKGYLAASEMYRFATVESVREDYAPGEAATLKGQGWKPGETVMLNVAAFPLDRHGIEFTATARADGNGEVEFIGFDIDRSHLGTRFLATATGIESQAQTGFLVAVLPTISITTLPAVPVVGSPVAITIALSGAFTPTGQVQLVIDHVSVGGLVALISGSATVNYAGFTAGAHTIGFNYLGDVNFLPFFDAVPVPGNPIPLLQLMPTTVTINVAPGTANLGNSVTISGQVTPASGPAVSSGSVLIILDGSLIATVPVNSTGNYTLSYSLASGGVHTVAANYLENSPWASSNSSTGLTVNRILPPLITISTLPVSPSFGATVAITIALSSAAGYIPTGQVQLVIDHVSIGGLIDLISGSVTVNYAGFTVGNHTIGFNYLGDSNYLPFFDAVPITGNPITVTVIKANQVITVTLAAPASAAINSSFNVTATAPGGTVAIGVTGPCSILAGTVTMTGASGTCVVTFSQAGNANYNAAPDVVQNTNATKAAQTISVSQAAPASAVYNSTFPVAATAPGGAVSIGVTGVCTVTTGNVTMTSGTGTCTVTFSQGGNATYNAAPDVIQTTAATKAATTVTTPVASGVNTFGQTITLSTTLAAAGGGAPTGTIAFIDGSTPIGTGSVIGGASASITTSSLAAGGHSITAIFNGDANFSASAPSSALALNIGPAASPAVITSPNIIFVGQTLSYGQPVALVATFTGVSGSPVGGAGVTVRFLDGPAIVCVSVAVANGVATCNSTATGALGLGPHTITVATLNGDPRYTLGAVTPLDFTVNQAGTSTNLSGPSNPNVNQTVSFTASIGVTAPGAAALTGTVGFTLNGSALSTCQNVVLTAGAATCSTSFTQVGSYAIGATYSGDANTTASSGLLPVNVGTPPSEITTSSVNLSSSLSAPTVAQPITFTAVIGTSGNTPPTGTVQFFDGTTLIGTVTVNGGQAKFTVTLGAGVHNVTAVYSGDGVNTSSSSNPYGQYVYRISTVVIVTTAELIPVYGQPTAIKASLTVPPPVGFSMPSGPVQFFDGLNLIGTGTLSGGVATIAAANLDAGVHQISAIYNGDASWNSSRSSAVGQTVRQASTTVAVTPLPDVSQTEAQVTLTANVSVILPGGGVPGGSVQFVDATSNAVLGTAPVVGGVATVIVKDASAGRLIVGTYSGNINFVGGKSPAATQIAIFNAAGFTSPFSAPDAIMSIFGFNLADATVSADRTPLPANLAGTNVKVKDGAGVERAAQLFYASPTQINLLVPSDTISGNITVTVTNSSGGSFAIVTKTTSTAPGLFSANSTGKGIASAQVVRVRANGSQSIENVARFDESQKTFVPAPLDLSSATDQLFVVLYGTGLRYGGSGATTVTIGGQALPVLFSGPHSFFAGLDQINVGPLPASLKGAGAVNVQVVVNGQSANAVSLTIQ